MTKVVVTTNAANRVRFKDLIVGNYYMLTEDDGPYFCGLQDGVPCMWRLIGGYSVDTKHSPYWTPVKAIRIDVEV